MHQLKMKHILKAHKVIESLAVYLEYTSVQEERKEVWVFKYFFLRNDTNKFAD